LRDPATTPPDGPTDAQLVARWQAGDESGFEGLVGRYGDRLMGFLVRYCNGNRQAAEEAYAETWLRLVRRPDAYSPQAGASFRSWLYTVARRCGLDAQRSRRRFSALVTKMLAFGLGNETSAPDAERSFGRSEMATVLDGAMEVLSEEHRTAVLLFYRYDFDTAEVGQVLGLGDQQVRDKLTYARRKLRDALGADPR